MKPHVPPKIKEAIEKNSLVLFIGAGISIPLGLPNWIQLIEGLITEVAQRDKPSIKSLFELFKNGDLGTFDALDILLPYENTVRNYLEKRLQTDIDYSKVNLGLHAKLWQISTQIITPNYDEALEKSNLQATSFTYDNLSKLGKFNDLKEYVFKIHGSIDNSAKCILFKRDYENLYTDKNAAIFELKSTLAHKTILFLGFSMNDPYVKYIAEYIAEIYGSLKDKHYIITTEPTDLESADIKPISLVNWSELESFVDDLIAIKNKSSSQIIEKERPYDPLPEPLIYSSSKNSLNQYPKPDSLLFTGREKEKQLFKNALEKHNLFAIEGLGGIGKTEFTTNCIEEFIENKDRIIWLDGNESSKFDVFVQSAGYEDVIKGENKIQEASFDSFKQLIERDQRIIFWDNFQSIKDPTFNAFVDFIQKYLKQCIIVFIAKEEIYVNNSPIHTIHIKGLEENAFEYAKKLKDSEQRFENLQDEDLITLCEKTLGHPLAIKLSLPLLAKGFDVNELFSNIGEFKGVKEVEQLTRRIFKEVYQHTNDNEKELLQKFSVYQQKVTKDAIDKIYIKRDLPIVLLALIDKFLITFENGFYETHPLIRELSNDLLDLKIETNACAVEYYLQQRTDFLNPALEERIYYHLAQSNQNDLVEQEINDKGRRYILLGQLGLVDELIDILKTAGINLPIFNIFHGDIAVVHGNWDDAKKYYENAAAQSIDMRSKIEGIIKVGEMLYRKNKELEALPYFEDAYTLSKVNGFRKEEARALNDVALIYDFTNDLTVSEQKHIEALQIRQEENDWEGVAISLGNIGRIMSSQGKHEEARVKQNQALEINIRIGNKSGESTSLSAIGGILFDQGNYSESLKYLKNSVNVNMEIGGEMASPITYFNMAVIYASKRYKDFKNAILNYFKCLRIEKKLGLDPTVTIRQLKFIRDKEIGIQEFKLILSKPYDQLNEEEKKTIPMDELCNPGYKFKKIIGKNDICPFCDSGKQYKRCHGKNK